MPSIFRKRRKISPSPRNWRVIINRLFVCVCVCVCVTGSLFDGTGGDGERVDTPSSKYSTTAGNHWHCELCNPKWQRERERERVNVH